MDTRENTCEYFKSNLTCQGGLLILKQGIEQENGNST